MRFSGLWRHRDFVRLWAAATVSTFGSLVTRTALPFVAILILDATPFDISLLVIAELGPGFAIGLVAGAWVDRLRRRPVLIVADLGRAALLLSIPIAALGGWLSLPHLLIVAAGGSLLTVIFDVAYLAYLPSLVQRADLLEANSNVTAAGAVAEAAAFSSGGWLVQWLTAPFAILVDALTFLASAWFVWRIKTSEPVGITTAEDRQNRRIVGEITEGLRVVATNATLRALAGSTAALNVSFGIGGAVFLLYVNQEVGFDPGVLGLIFALGGVASLAGAIASARVTRFGLGRTLIAALVVTAVGQGLVPFATTTSLVAVVLLVGQQLLGDFAATIYEVNQVSLRQAITASALQGRVNASVRVLETGGTLLGALLGGIGAEAIGIRTMLIVGVAIILLGAGWLFASPVRQLMATPLELPAADPSIVP